MGGLALAILWINTLLIAAVALKQANEKRRLLGALRPLAPGAEGPGLVAGRIDEGRGEGGALALYEVEQIARAGAESGGPPHDPFRRSHVRGRGARRRRDGRRDARRGARR